MTLSLIAIGITLFLLFLLWWNNVYMVRRQVRRMDEYVRLCRRLGTKPVGLDDFPWKPSLLTNLLAIIGILFAGMAIFASS